MSLVRFQWAPLKADETPKKFGVFVLVEVAGSIALKKERKNTAVEAYGLLWYLFRDSIELF